MKGPDAARFTREIQRTLENLHRYRYFAWERQFEMDGQVDSIESALYLLNRLPVESAFKWLEEEIGVLFSLQKPDGSVNKDYLDGNFIRSSLLYAFYKTCGAFLQPWREDVRIGAFNTGTGLYLHLETEQPWKGRVIFDSARHQQYRTVNYPRVNEWPEWFTADKGSVYVVSDVKKNTARTYTGGELLHGIDMSLDNHQECTLLVKKQSAAD